MVKILIVDDEIMIREVVKEYADSKGYLCDGASDGMEALKMIEDGDYDIVLLDIMMPNLDGFTALKKIKALKDIPVIMLSARQEESDKLFSFENGVDDYVTKPFSPNELMARIKAVLDRTRAKEPKVVRIDDLLIDIDARKVMIEDEVLNLTPKEIDLLIYLVTHQNMALSREKLLDAVWDYDFYGDDRTVDTHIKMLRHHLGEKYRDHIVTVRGMGYRFEA